MVTGQLTTFLRLLVGRKIDGSDRQLLERFVADADEVAFAALVDRHGRLVFGVCRSVLRHEQDAEDAFQATFLVLARLASSIRKRDSLASWLHGVALRTALKARRAMANRRRNEQKASVPFQQEPVSEAALREVQSILHEEIERLPDKYRAPFVLCCLEGKSRAEAAQQLGWKEGTVSGRIAQARSLLEGRLARRGVALPAALAAAVLLQAPAKAAVSIVVHAALDFAAGSVSEILSPFAATLAQGVIQAMLVTKLKTIAAVALVWAVVLAGGGWLAYASLQPEEQNPANGAPPPDLAGKVPQQPKPPADEPAPPQGDQPPEGEPALPPLAVKRLGSLKWQFPLAVNDLAYSGDGKWLVTCCGDHVWVHDPATGKELRSFPAQTHHRFNSIQPFFLATDGKVAVSGRDRKIRIWDAATGKQMYSYPGSVDNLCGTADGKILAGLGYLGDFGAPPKTPDPLPPGMERKARVWNAATGKPLKPFADGITGAFSVALAPDGQTLAWRTQDGTVHVVNVSDGKERFKVDAPLIGSKPEDFRPEPVNPNTWRFPEWGAPVGPQLPLKFHPQHALAFSPDSKLLAYGSREGLMLVDAAGGKEARKFPRRQQPIKIQPLNGEGVPDDRIVPLYPPPRPIIKKPDVMKPENIWKITFVPAEDKVVALSISENAEGNYSEGDGAFGVWDIDSGKETARFSGPATTKFAISPDGKTIAAARDVKIAFLDNATGKMRIQPGQFTSVPRAAFSPDGKIVATTSWEDAKIRLWDRSAGEVRHTIQFEPDPAGRGFPEALAFSPDSTTLIGLGHPGTMHPSGNKTPGREFDTTWQFKPFFWDIQTGEEKKRDQSSTLKMESTDSSMAVISADGKTIAAGLKGGVICLWDLASGKLSRLQLSHKGWVHPVAFSADGKKLAAGTGDLGDVFQTDKALMDRAVYVLDITTGKEICRIPASQVKMFVSTVDMSPDGKLVTALGSNDEVEPSGRIRRQHTFAVWDTATGKELYRHNFGVSSGLSAQAFAPDGKTLALAINHGSIENFPLEYVSQIKIHLIDAKTMQPVRVLERGHLQQINTLSFSADSRILVSASSDGTALIWDLSKIERRER